MKGQESVKYCSSNILSFYYSVTHNILFCCFLSENCMNHFGFRSDANFSSPKCRIMNPFSTAVFMPTIFKEINPNKSYRLTIFQTWNSQFDTSAFKALSATQNDALEVHKTGCLIMHHGNNAESSQKELSAWLSTCIKQPSVIDSHNGT